MSFREYILELVWWYSMPCDAGILMGSGIILAKKYEKLTKMHCVILAVKN